MYKCCNFFPNWCCRWFTNALAFVWILEMIISIVTFHLGPTQRLYQSSFGRVDHLCYDVPAWRTVIPQLHPSLCCSVPSVHPILHHVGLSECLYRHIVMCPYNRWLTTIISLVTSPEIVPSRNLELCLEAVKFWYYTSYSPCTAWSYSALEDDYISSIAIGVNADKRLVVLDLLQIVFIHIMVKLKNSSKILRTWVPHLRINVSLFILTIWWRWYIYSIIPPLPTKK